VLIVARFIWGGVKVAFKNLLPIAVRTRWDRVITDMNILVKSISLSHAVYLCSFHSDDESKCSGQLKSY